jgi:hypothetical protein
MDLLAELLLTFPLKSEEFYGRYDDDENNIPGEGKSEA